MKGILLAGGHGTRLYPLTRAISKQLLPVYDKPMIYYPLSTLMLAGLSDILIISTPQDTPRIQGVLGDGSRFGIRLSYKIQDEPKGIAEALILAEDFLNGDSSMLMLGDNLMFGARFQKRLSQAIEDVTQNQGAHLFTYRVKDPSAFGVAVMGEDDRIVDLVEKPKTFLSPYAVIGLYVYDGTAPARARALKPSARGELEINDLNRTYLAEGAIRATSLGRGFMWMDAGTPDNLLKAGEFVHLIEERTSVKIGCLEEVALLKGWISEAELQDSIRHAGKSEYGHYLQHLLKTPVHERHLSAV
ncbi:MAG: glucose-1-phosphate thymidylyltransferase RfbA [bacterium]